MHEFISLPDLYQLLDHIAAALPEVAQSEELSILIGDVKTAIDHEHIDPREFIDLNDVLWALEAQAKPEVTSVDPRELNRRGWTCGCEPGNYDTCDECQSACNELAGFLNRPEVKR